MLAKGASHTALGRLTRFVSPVRWHHYHRLIAQGFRRQRHAQSGMSGYCYYAEFTYCIVKAFASHFTSLGCFWRTVPYTKSFPDSWIIAVRNLLAVPMQHRLLMVTAQTQRIYSSSLSRRPRLAFSAMSRLAAAWDLEADGLGGTGVRQDGSADPALRGVHVIYRTAQSCTLAHTAASA
jgi:hypothetical protein